MEKSSIFDKNCADIVCNRLQEARVEKKMTIKDVSEACGIPLPTLGRFFANPTANPSFFTVSAVAVALGVSLDSLVADACNAEPPTPCPGEIEILHSRIDMLESQLEGAKQLLGKTEQQVEILKRSHKIMEKGVAERKPIIFGLCGLAILLAAALFSYLSADFAAADIGFIRGREISSPVLGVLLIAIVCVLLFLAHTYVSRRVKSRRAEGEKNENP